MTRHKKEGFSNAAYAVMDASLHLGFAVALYFFAIASLMASPGPAWADDDEDDDDEDEDAAAADAPASLAERFLDASAPDADDADDEDDDDAAAAELPPPEKTSNRSSLNRSAMTLVFGVTQRRRGNGPTARSAPRQFWKMCIALSSRPAERGEQLDSTTQEAISV
jgi:hypothetical protein